MAKLFHIPKPKRFSYKPRFYNEVEELRKEREVRLKREVEAEKQGRSTEFSREGMANYIKFARRTRKKSNMRILVILVILLMLFYFFMK